MAGLKMLRGPEPGLEFDLVNETIYIGRGRKNDIIIQDNEVSRQHCRLVRVLDDYEIHDLRSTNGTFINGQRLDSSGWLLSSGAIVELGDSITLEYFPDYVDIGTSPPDLDAHNNIDKQAVYLIVKQASRPKPELYKLDRGILSIGRDVDNDIVLSEPEVSRHHLRLLLSDDGYTVEDLNTMNGTLLNGQPLQQQCLLYNTDVIAIGQNLEMWYTGEPDRVLKYLADGDAPSSPPTLDSRTIPTRPFSPMAGTSTIPSTDRIRQMFSGLKPNQLEGHVFIAYALEDYATMGNTVRMYLESKGVKAWGEWNFDPGTIEWTSAIEQALSECPILLVIVSENALNTTYVQRSIRHFKAREKPILLLEFDSVDRLPMEIDSTPAVIFDRDDPKQALRDILTEIRRLEAG